ncbi:unnamed protein product [Cyprideis torosa]|uniref:Uncharacterized protein n=1 Tax=Cyprideis torosa TaxID=163714 RepID=A0A7R8ZFM8_9CRUS|nr:unnamed protein product [Cyprideis torosa]CAG0879496.1 unnamed protein product [Cyprideis torosa]
MIGPSKEPSLDFDSGEGVSPIRDCKNNKSLLLTITHHAFMEISINGIPQDLVKIGLCGRTVPHTVRNFATIANQGIRGKTYNGTRIHRIMRHFVVQAGDITAGDGTGGMSIYNKGRSFADENFDIPHVSGGTISMANNGSNSNRSQFFFTLLPMPSLDGKHVAFGKVLSNMRIISQLENLQTDWLGKPMQPVIIEKLWVEKVNKRYTVEADPYDFWVWLRLISLPTAWQASIVLLLVWFYRRIGRAEIVRDDLLRQVEVANSKKTGQEESASSPSLESHHDESEEQKKKCYLADRSEPHHLAGAHAVSLAERLRQKQEICFSTYEADRPPVYRVHCALNPLPRSLPLHDRDGMKAFVRRSSQITSLQAMSHQRQTPVLWQEGNEGLSVSQPSGRLAEGGLLFTQQVTSDLGSARRDRKRTNDDACDIDVERKLPNFIAAKRIPPRVRLPENVENEIIKCGYDKRDQKLNRIGNNTTDAASAAEENPDAETERVPLSPTTHSVIKDLNNWSGGEGILRDSTGPFRPGGIGLPPFIKVSSPKEPQDDEYQQKQCSSPLNIQKLILRFLQHELHLNPSFKEESE